MKKLILLTGLFAFLALNLSAQSKKEKINELFKLMKTEETLNATMDNMARMFKQQKPAGVDARKDSIFSAYLRTEMVAFARKLSEVEMVNLYDKYFTTGDIQKYIDFYKTEEGQKFLNMIPAIQTDLMDVMMKDHLPALQAKFKKKIEELG